jgi:diamine N-acetyltransferase
MNIEIRRITIDDVAVLSALAKKTFYDTFTGTCTEEDMQGFLQKNYNENVLAQELENDLNFVFFIAVDKAVVGYLHFKEAYDNFEEVKKYKALELKRLYVLNTHHGKGIAQVLMDYYLNFAEENNFELVWLGVWEHNIRAQKFYEKYGFVNSGFTHDFPIGNTPQTDFWFWKFLKK